MKPVLTLLLLCPYFLFAQIDQKALLGTWIKTKAEMKDGSRIIDRLGTSGANGFLRYRFVDNEAVDFSTTVLSDQNSLKYNLAGNVLTIASQSYNILKLTRDSLIIQDNDPGLNDNKLKVFYFANLESYRNLNDRPAFNETLKDSVYSINSFIYPESKIAVGKVYKKLQSIQDNGKLAIRFIITGNGSIKDISIIKNDSLSKSEESKIIKDFQETDGLWHPAKVNNKPVNVDVSLTLKFTSLRSSGSNWSGLSVTYPLSSNDSIRPIPLKDLANEQTAYSKAIDYAKAHQYDKSLQEFNKCLDIDDLNIDAYYLRAAVYFQLGDIKSACKDWRRLSQLGQVLASKYLIKYSSYNN